MNLADLSQMVEDATHSAFRMETRPDYLVPQEEAEFAAWRSGARPSLASPDTSPWLDRIAATTASGFTWSRLRIVDYPLSVYTEFELHGLQANSRAGERVHVADRASDARLDDLHEDFWLIDNAIGVHMSYDRDGRFIGAHRADDVPDLIEMRSRGLRQAIDLAEYLSRREPHLVG